MNIAIRELLNIKGKKLIDYDIEELIFDNNPYLKALKDVKAKLELHYDSLDNLMAKISAKGEMICPCAITLEDVVVPFEINDETKLTFEEEEDAYLVANALDVEDFILTFILPEVPIKVVKNEKIEYPRGDGWRVMTEEAYQDMKNQEIDPRLAKFREYKFDEED